MMLNSKTATKKGSKTEYSWSKNGEFLYRHHEEPRLKLYDPDNETFPIPLKYVEDLSEHVINDRWTEAKGVNLSEEWIGTTRSQMIRTRLHEGYMRIKGRPKKIQ